MSDDLLSHEEAINQVLSTRPLGLVLDIDGTISEIAPRPSEARVSPSCRERIAALVGLLDLVAVISGRPVREAQRMLGLEDLVYLGNHGLERLKNGKVLLDPKVLPYRERIRAAAAKLALRLSEQPGLEGLLVEDKGISTAFHYRACHDPVQARETILRVLEGTDEARGLRVMEARRAVELLPPIQIDKGSALMALAKEFSLKGLFYLGDDCTDISAFRALRAWRDDNDNRGLAVAVVSPDSPEEVQREADLTLEGVSGVEVFLESIAMT
ncbi:MAG: trehalose-phosphatase, partial [Dehalococcoidia bacterium]|nr:trehalose-phosphatase [Dehalococcoidia bacterium]